MLGIIKNCDVPRMRDDLKRYMLFIYELRSIWIDEKADFIQKFIESVLRNTKITMKIRTGMYPMMSADKLNRLIRFELRWSCVDMSEVQAFVDSFEAQEVVEPLDLMWTGLNIFRVT